MEPANRARSGPPVASPRAPACAVCGIGHAWLMCGSCIAPGAGFVEWPLQRQVGSDSPYCCIWWFPEPPSGTWPTGRRRSGNFSHTPHIAAWSLCGSAQGAARSAQGAMLRSRKWPWGICGGGTVLSGCKDVRKEALLIAATIETGGLEVQIDSKALGPVPLRKRLLLWQRACPRIAKFGCRGPCGPRCRLAQRTNHMTNGMLSTGMHHI